MSPRSAPVRTMGHAAGWRFAQLVLLVIWLAAAVLTMLHRRAGLFTSYGADLLLPAWLYIIFRREAPLLPWVRVLRPNSPALTAVGLFAASTLTELSQRFWPRGLFAGRYDPVDILAYGLGLGLCYWADRRWPIPRG